MTIIEYKKGKVVLRLVGCADLPAKYWEYLIVDVARARQVAGVWRGAAVEYAEWSSEDFTEWFLKHRDVCIRHTLRGLRKIERYLSGKK